MTRLNPHARGPVAETLETELRRRVIGQEEAIQQILGLYQTNLAGLSAPGRPLGSVLFLGPTGSGKTRMVEATAECLAGSASAVLKVDCAEFQHSHEIAKIIGSPPGYLGHRDTHPVLTQEALDRHHTDKVKISFLLFDEIEKANDALWNLLLGIMDKATLTLGDNRRVDFSRCLIFMTSNLGAAQMEALLRPSVGFSSTEGGTERSTVTTDALKRCAVAAARKRFTPEFINRLDRMVVFQALTRAELRQVLDLELAAVQARLLNAVAFVLQVTDQAKDWLLQEGLDPRYGARHLKRAVERLLVRPLANLIATGQVQVADLVTVALDEASSALVFSKDDRGVPPVVSSYGVGLVVKTMKATT